MENQVDNKFTWVIKNFSNLQSHVFSSDQFVIGGCNWRILAYPKGFNKNGFFSLFLEVADYKSLPSGWRRQARYLLTIVNQNSDTNSKRNESNKCFDNKTPGWGMSAMLPLNKLHEKDGGFLVNNELKIVAEVEVFEVIGKLDVFEETEVVNQPLKKIKLDVDCVDPSIVLHKEHSLVMESIDVNGFQVLPSQVDFVRRIFAKHPNIALEVRPKNQHLRKACMNFMLSLIETLCQSLQDLSNEDLVEADFALTYLKDAGFKLDWLEKKLVQVKQMKKEEQISETRLQEVEKELEEFKQKCFDMEALLENEKAKLFAARGASLTLDDVV
ncbi:hypothetical protein AALP_AA5G227600 [Arabis alpina]|uniref:MATH domain-containing protein n=1 Tax=Arabis alpina TaxID=50452 RepID=A0A087GYU5_ARAAL|nr:hypothetical protein AALP_AA5G227600 [Arabis alpina]